jgi:16S rRNA C967 or C1407 C5-methylase (RsmB/RsmF family)
MERTWDPSVQWDPEVETFLGNALGIDRLKAISQATSRPPLLTCLRVNTLRTTAEDVLRRLPTALATEDQQLLAQAGAEPYIHPDIPFAIMIPGTGPHPVDYSQCQGLEVVVGRRAGESMLRGSNAYAPGILACTTGIMAGDTVAVSVGIELPGKNPPLFGCTRGTVLPQGLPLDDPRFPQRGKLFIGAGRAEVSRSGMNPSSTGLVVSLTDRVFRTLALGEIFPGDIMLQNLPSLTAAVVLDPKPGARVLDMCAAPGGKTTAMAQIMKNTGEIIALDRSHNKVAGIERLAEEFGITCINAYRHDATKAIATEESRAKRKYDDDYEASGVVNEKVKARLDRKAAGKLLHGKNPTPTRCATTAGFERESFEYILLDAPCSTLGLRPRLIVPQTLKELHNAAHYQRKLIDAAVHLLKPGGFMVYSTCTINPLENEGNVRYVLEKYPFMKLAVQFPKLGGPGLIGEVPGDEPGYTKKLLKDEIEADMVQRFDPSTGLDTPGFFIAKFEKIKSSI